MAGPALAKLDAASLRGAAEGALGRVERRMHRRLRGPVQLYVVDEQRLLDPEIAPHFHEWTVALANTRTGRIDVLLPRIRTEPPGDLGTVLAHEFVHVLLGEMEVTASSGSKHLPVWLHEGLAQHLAGQGWFPRYERALLFRALNDNLLGFGEIERSFPEDSGLVKIAYAQSLAYLQFVIEQVGLTKVLVACEGWLSGEYESLDHALTHKTGRSFGSLAADWRRELTSSRTIFELLGASCFEITMWLCLPLLLFAAWRRMRTGRWIGQRMRNEERFEDAMAAHVGLDAEDGPWSEESGASEVEPETEWRSDEDTDPEEEEWPPGIR